MDETKLQKRLKKTIKYAAVTGAVLVAVGVFLSWFLRDTLDQAVEEQMHSETGEYVDRLHRQMNTDLQLLETVARLLGDSGVSEEEDFPEMLERMNEENDFLTMGWFTASGESVLAARDRVYEIPTEENQEEVQEVVRAAFSGERPISQLFKSNLSGDNVFIYGVPVERDGEITAVLCASDRIEIFTDILDGKGVLGGTGHIHMLGQDGNFLIRSGQAVVQEKRTSILEPPYLSGEEADEIYEKMQKEEEIRFSFRYEGRNYRAYLEPVRVNGWYLFCVNSVEASSALMVLVVRVFGGVFGAVLVLIALWLAYAQKVIRENTKELENAAFYDSLTGALNFPRFRQLAEEKSKADGNCAVVCLNIHQFKSINEIFGKDQADRLLCYLADKIRRELREDELFCRESADFFYLCLRDGERARIRERLERIMRMDLEYEAREDSGYHVLMYCGAVISGEGEPPYTLDQMMNHVMFALAKARETHQNNVWFFDSKLHEREKMDNYVESHMYQALEDREFRLFLQPKVDLRSGRVSSAEALVRWIRQDGTMIFPGQFIPIFESNGFCTKLDLYMIDRVCECIRGWIDRGITPVPVSVNQSKAVLYEPDYINSLRDMIVKWDVRPELITLEILEGVALENPEELNHKLRLLQKIGFRISMDDFGSGYSSLNTLAKLRIDELKLDRGFLKEAEEDRSGKSWVIMEQIAELAGKLKIWTVVEGVETKENDRMIRELGCDSGQGYYYGKPAAAEEFTGAFLSRE